jgi:transposase
LTSTKQKQVAVLDDEGQVNQEVRVANADLDEIAQQYAGNEAALKAGSNSRSSIDLRSISA